MRLATTGSNGANGTRGSLRRGLAVGEDPMTTVRLVGAHAVKSGFLRHGLGDTTPTRYARPALLVSWWYWQTFSEEREHYSFRDYSLDSGAFSAHNSGVTIDFQEYQTAAATLLASDPQCTEVFALDVIGDWRASLRNTETMWEAGIPAIPTYHIGEPEHVLKHLAATYPKIAIGGAVGLHLARKKEWIRQVFARVWPKPIHGLGMGSEQLAMGFPFHSMDATNWEMAPAAYGNWKSMPGGSIRGGNQPLRMEVEWYLRLEERVQARWRKEMTLLAEMLEKDTPASIRLAVVARGNNRIIGGLRDPAMRLAVAAPNTQSGTAKRARKGLAG
jgi:hypothetical protein